MSRSKLIWNIIRTLTFITVGLFNTVLIRSEDVGTWKNFIGYIFILCAILDIVSLFFKRKRSRN